MSDEKRYGTTIYVVLSHVTCLFLCENDSAQQLVFQTLDGHSEVDDGRPRTHLRINMCFFLIFFRHYMIFNM